MNRENDAQIHMEVYKGKKIKIQHISTEENFLQ